MFPNVPNSYCLLLWQWSHFVVCSLRTCPRSQLVPYRKTVGGTSVSLDLLWWWLHRNELVVFLNVLTSFPDLFERFPYFEDSQMGLIRLFLLSCDSFDKEIVSIRYKLFYAYGLFNGFEGKHDVIVYFWILLFENGSLHVNI